MDPISQILSDPRTIAAIQLLLAALIGFVVGHEREEKGKTVGSRTFALVCLGSCLFTIISQTAFQPIEWARIPAAIITGIGFICAGVIWRQRGDAIHGLTTAADIWVSAGLGIAIGVGMYVIGLFAAALIWMILQLPCPPQECIPPEFPPHPHHHH